MSPSDQNETSADLFALWRQGILNILTRATNTVSDDNLTVGERVHATRRFAKQARALLKLAPSHLKDQSRSERAQLRESRKAFGPARDARVAYDLLAEKLNHEKQQTETAPQLLSNLQRICADIESHTKAQVFPATHAHVQTIAQHIKDWPAQDLSLDELHERIRSGYKQARQLRPRKSKGDDLHSLHGFRSALVDHYYQLDFLPRADAKKITKRKARLKELRTDLGLYLDHHHLLTLTQQHNAQHVLTPDTDLDTSPAKIVPRLIKDARELFEPSADEMIESLID